MRVAIAVDNGIISAHFGHCEYFLVYNLEGKEIKSTESIKNPPHQKGLLPKFLNEHGINCLITGNIGAMAVNLLDELGIETIRGCRGTAEEIISKYLSNSLESTNEICEEHAHHNH